LPIAEHGLIGDLHTVALVGTDGTIDWCCCPRFDAPSVFAAILDSSKGGLFRISPDCDGWTSKVLYLPDTKVLITLPHATGSGGGVALARADRAERPRDGGVLTLVSVVVLSPPCILTETRDRGRHRLFSTQCRRP